MLLHVLVGAHFQSLHVQIPSPIPFGEISETIPDLRRESQRFRDFLHYSHPSLKLLKLFSVISHTSFQRYVHFGADSPAAGNCLACRTAWLAGLPSL